MTRDEIRSQILRANPMAGAQAATIWTDWYLLYQEARENVTANGSVCADPRTGQPIQNPYLAILEKATKALAGMKAIRHTGDIWKEAP